MDVSINMLTIGRYAINDDVDEIIISIVRVLIFYFPSGEIVPQFFAMCNSKKCDKFFLLSGTYELTYVGPLLFWPDSHTLLTISEYLFDYEP